MKRRLAFKVLVKAVRMGDRAGLPYLPAHRATTFAAACRRVNQHDAAMGRIYVTRLILAGVKPVRQEAP